MKAVRDTPYSDGACVYEVSSNYVERSKTYGPDKQKVDDRPPARPHAHQAPYHNTSRLRRAYKKKKTSRECFRNIDAPGVTWLKQGKIVKRKNCQSPSVKDMLKIWPGLAYAQRAV
jgi:hypothetical protein